MKVYLLWEARMDGNKLHSIYHTHELADHEYVRRCKQWIEDNPKKPIQDCGYWIEEREVEA